MILRAPDGDEFILAGIDDFNREIELTRENKRFMRLLDSRGKQKALYNNLNHNEELAIKIDDVVKQVRPDGWRGIQAREQIIKAALYGVLQNKDQVERIFLIIKQHTEY